ncbi:hypothetical protein ACL02O_23530 [Micromonospora sp. MS34]
MVGTQVTAVALPLVASLTLDDARVAAAEPTAEPGRRERDRLSPAAGR